MMRRFRCLTARTSISTERSDFEHGGITKEKSRRLRHPPVFGACPTWRTSIGMISGLPPGPGAADALAAIS